MYVERWDSFGNDFDRTHDSGGDEKLGISSQLATSGKRTRYKSNTNIDSPLL